MTDNTISINLVIKDERLKRKFEDMIASLKGLRVVAATTPPPVDLLIIELGARLTRSLN